MSRFDPRAYEDAVVKPLRRWSSRELPDDLVTRYAVEPGMTDAQLANRLVEVRALWNKGATSTGKAAAIRGIYKAFLTADVELKAREGADLDTAAWWRRFAARRASSRQGEVDDLAQTLRATFGTLGLVAAGQLEATMRAMSASLAPDEVDKALLAAGIRREVPLDLPKTSGLQDTVYRTLRARLADARMGSVVELLHGETPGFRILRSFSTTPPSTGGLGLAAVEQAIDRANRRSGNQADREALGILASAARGDVDLRALAVFHLLDEIRQNHAHGVPDAALLRQLRTSGLDDAEARLAVFSVRNETAVPRASGVTGVGELLADGKLVAARQLMATIGSSEDAAAARALVDRQTEQVVALRVAARESLRTGAEAEAYHQLRQAAVLAVDDEDLAAELRRVPPAPVLEVSTAQEGMGVRVSWRTPADHSDETGYRVVRRPDRVPRDPDDGVPVRDGPGAAVTVDGKAPAGITVGYAVFARVADGAWSRPVGGVIVPLPPVQDVRITHEGAVVNAQWKVHPETAEVEVTRQSPGHSGVPVRLTGRTSFTEHVVGDEHGYSFVARYRRSDGSMGSSPAVLVRSTGVERLAPVPALRITAVAGPRVAITWRKPGPAEVTIRRATAPAPWGFGETVSTAALVEHGEEVRGDLGDDGEWRTLTAAVPTGLFHYTAFTHGPAGVLRGQEDVFGVALPVTAVAARRLGDRHVLSWTWPEDAGTAEVSWPGGSRRITRAQYRDEGGCGLDCGSGQTVVSVVGVVASAGGECRSVPVEVVVAGRVPAVRYTVAVSRRLFGAGQVRVRLTADTPVARCSVVLVVAPGRVMPLRADQGQVLLRETRDIGAAEPVELVAELPRLRPPFWVRCFLPDGEPVRLVDPPTAQLKVP
ncbi:hypothetical protein [Actinokineospora sp. NBRC 105648]|uniref:hypothetical protein n=1 Tax=Actinokineospora sp. NBRC 105648 TaxID=3032206 RepID=UPI0024A016A3|nr:hypothetical protein [Actinokineospora sp. NBRC 105648]GLZ42331.1 hypothetical protein Acsp05_59550 [Actinokineospora sp. NBRC 105648]